MRKMLRLILQHGKKAKAEGDDEARAHYATQYSIVKQFLDESDKLEKSFQITRFAG